MRKILPVTSILLLLSSVGALTYRLYQVQHLSLWLRLRDDDNNDACYYC